MIKRQKYKLKKHKLGFYQICPLPKQQELEQYYRDKYFQKPTVSTYSRTYSRSELLYNKIACEVTDFIALKLGLKGQKTVLDVGCGEGFFLKGLKDLKWKVLGTDLSCEGVKTQNFSIINKIRFGPAEKILGQLRQQKVQFSLVNLGNILEHVINPILLLKDIFPLLQANGILRVVVPNDASGFQAMLKKEKRSQGSWIHPPDHLSYFNFRSLKKVLSSCNYTPVFELGDFPIELFLLNKHSNYENQKKTGTEAHYARVKTSLYVRSRGLENYIKWASGLASGDTTRSCILFAKKKRVK